MKKYVFSPKIQMCSALQNESSTFGIQDGRNHIPYWGWSYCEAKNTLYIYMPWGLKIPKHHQKMEQVKTVLMTTYRYKVMKIRMTSILDKKLTEKLHFRLCWELLCRDNVYWNNLTRSVCHPAHHEYKVCHYQIYKNYPWIF